MQKKEKTLSPAAEFLIRTLLDPILLYTTLIMSVLMYHYYDKSMTQFVVASYVVTYFLFRLFDFMNKRKIIGGVLYIFTGYLFYLAVVYFGRRGWDYYEEVLQTKNISYGLWFITPQLALDYNIWYSRLTFMLFSFFMASVIYYFTRIRYRVFMGFLIFIIPFLIYGKEYEKMPVIFIILLAASYIAVMVYCRQLHNVGNVTIVRQRDILTSSGIFLVVMTIIASVIPKPVVKENREAIENFIAAERFTDRLVASLSGFRGSSNGSQFRGVSSNTQLYAVEANEPLRFKTRTFSEYSYDSDGWSAYRYDSTPSLEGRNLPLEIAATGETVDDILYVASLDKSFAKKYGLEEYAGRQMKKPEVREAGLITLFDTGERVPVPQFAQALNASSYEGEFSYFPTGLIAADSSIELQDGFRFEYSADTYFNDKDNKAVIDIIDKSDYAALLADAIDIIYNRMDEESDHKVYKKYSEAYTGLISAKNAYKYAQMELDYGDKVRIKELADEITKDKLSDYDKAKALEMYFFNNDYIYDLSYVKSEGENAENFLFVTHRGVCYEYATAMVMLARAAGIPARYCEGYNMQSKQNSGKYAGDYVITAKDSHGYPELYIKGFGWTSFEPTITSGEVQEEVERGEATHKLSTAGIVILIIALLALLGYICSPFIIDRVFIRVNRRRRPSAAAIAVIRRISRLYGLGRTCTSGEISKAVMERCGVDISATAALFDAAAYGGAELNEAAREKVLADYSAAYAALIENKKKQRKLFKRKV